MGQGIAKKKPGSRRYMEASGDRTNLRPRLPDGTLTPLEDLVGIDFICLGCDAVLGQFRMTTVPNSPRAVSMLELPGGMLPEEAGRPDGQSKGLLVCGRCGRDTQCSMQRITAALDALWKPNLRRVVEYKV
jgi:hypothetical protein